ncbi:polymer-forming cytoskeletal protein [Pelagibius sp.]|uniref:bactofilin family protein n=1 Tax=Pelagibius sp. TaxID=1931238 RepID=UPI002608CA65|nr:polymer-forming cytoskeletal protein [Pelagibius sp.]
MFGKRKGSGSSHGPNGEQNAVESGPLTSSLPNSLPGHPEGDPAAESRNAELAAKPSVGLAGIKAPRRPEPRSAGAVEGRKLVVGREICLSGEIKTCEKLVVEGRVEADLNDSQSLEISEPGLFKGHATVEDCEVRGTFEGELTVTGCLVIHETGQVSGKIRYTDIEIVKGGRLSGDIDALEVSLKGRLRGEGPKLAHSSDAPDQQSKTQAGTAGSKAG